MSEPKPDLATLEAAFQAYVLKNDSAFLDAVRNGPHAAAEDLAAIYFAAYRLRLVAALASDYEVLAAHLGASFEEIALDFIAIHPSGTRNLRWYATGLPEYLSGRNLDKAADIAGFERALATAFDAADEAFVSPADLQAIAPEYWGAIRFRFHPSLQLMKLNWSAPALWEGGTVERLAAPEIHAVWRRDLQPLFRRLDADEAMALDAARRGTCFEDICEALERRLGPDQAAPAAASYLRNWLEHGLIAALGTGASP